MHDIQSDWCIHFNGRTTATSTADRIGLTPHSEKHCGLLAWRCTPAGLYCLAIWHIRQRHVSVCRRHVAGSDVFICRRLKALNVLRQWSGKLIISEEELRAADDSWQTLVGSRV